MLAAVAAISAVLGQWRDAKMDYSQEPDGQGMRVIPQLDQSVVPKDESPIVHDANGVQDSGKYIQNRANVLDGVVTKAMLASDAMDMIHASSADFGVVADTNSFWTLYDRIPRMAGTVQPDRAAGVYLRSDVDNFYHHSVAAVLWEGRRVILRTGTTAVLKADASVRPSSYEVVIDKNPVSRLLPQRGVAPI